LIYCSLQLTPILQLTTEELWAFCLYTMSQTNRPSIVRNNMHVNSPIRRQKMENASPTLFVHVSVCFFLMNRVDIRNWIRNIEQHASDNVNKILVGNKVDMDAKRVRDFSSSSYYKITSTAS
jgi:hypothetical protein